MHYYVYSLIDPRNDQPFYIGKGKGNRYKRHLAENKHATINLKKFNKIEAIRSAGLEPIAKIIAYFDTEEKAYEYERHLIQESADLTNIQPGGQGGRGNDQWKTDNPSSKIKGLTYEQRYGSEKASWMRSIRSQKFAGRKFSYDTKQRMSKAATSRDHSYKQKRVSTPMGIFESVHSAALAYGISDSALSQRLSSANHKDFYRV